MGDWHEVNTAGAKIQAVTASDVKRVMGQYFKKENRAVAVYTRKAGSGSSTEDPDMNGLSPEQKPVARQITAAIQGEKDAAGLKAQLAKIEASLATADPKKQPLQKFMIRKIAARIAQIEKP